MQCILVCSYIIFFTIYQQMKSITMSLTKQKGLSIIWQRVFLFNCVDVVDEMLLFKTIQILLAWICRYIDNHSHGDPSFYIKPKYNRYARTNQRD